MILHNFLVFEGIDGSGTSTQMKLLQSSLQNKRAIFTTEPTDKETGKFLRRMLKGDFAVHPDTAARLFAADRSEHVYGKDGIKEAVENGFLVVSDRYIFSSLAYQTTECGEALPRKLNEDFPLPEYLFFFDITPDISLQRITGRDVTEIYEKKDFLEKTATEYRKIVSYYEQNGNGMKVVRIDATQSVEAVQKIIWSIVSKLPILDM